MVIDGLNKTTKFLNKPTDEEISEGIDAILGRGLMHEDGTFVDEDTVSSIYFQISRRRDLFEMSYHIEQDYSKGYIIMTKENSVYPIEEQLKNDGKLEGLDWKKRSALVKKEVLKNKDISRKVKFTIKEI